MAPAFSEGNGARLLGNIFWINSQGGNGAGISCYNPAQDLLVNRTPGFIKIGTTGQDNSSITVTVRDLRMELLSGVAVIHEKASLILEDADIRRIYADPTSACKQPAVVAKSGANFATHRTRWFDIWNEGFVDTPVYSPAIAGGFGAGNLTIEDSEFRLVKEGGVIFWLGQPGSKVNIVSSRFDDAGGISIAGSSETQIVNSIWADDGAGIKRNERIINASAGEMNFIASTILFASVECDLECQVNDFGRGRILSWANAGDINFVGSAIGVSRPYAEFAVPPFTRLLDSRVPDGGDFSADTFTWIQPTENQDAAALRAITAQPGLLTAAPGLPVAPPLLLDYPSRATPLVPGELIDRIDNAACGQANELINPIDGSCITEEALGNPRWDGNDKRNIGAVQLTEAPHLSVTAVGDGTVDLTWTKPRDLDGLCGYRLTDRETGTTNDVVVDILDPDTLSYQVASPSNGIEYEFEGLVDCPDPDPSGFPSNIVTATPISGAVLDCDAAYPSLDRLWPPNHKLVPIDVLGIIDPDGDPITVSINGVLQDEPVNGKGDGNTSPDAEGIGTSTASVRAERAGPGNGRVYTVFFTAANDGGAQCAGSVEVGVPKSEKGVAVNDGPLFNPVFD